MLRFVFVFDLVLVLIEEEVHELDLVYLILIVLRGKNFLRCSRKDIQILPSALLFLLLFFLKLVLHNTEEILEMIAFLVLRLGLLNR